MEKESVKSPYQKAIETSHIYLMRKIYRSLIAISIAFPILAIWILVEKISRDFKIYLLHWIAFIVIFLASCLAYFLSRYTKKADTTIKRSLSIMGFLGIACFGFVGVIFFSVEG